jgi:hypothetical protein
MLVEWGGCLKTDSEIRDDVISELEWDPQVTDPDAAGVVVAARLYGHVHSLAKAGAAATAPGVASVDGRPGVSP